MVEVMEDLQFLVGTEADLRRLGFSAAAARRLWPLVEEIAGDTSFGGVGGVAKTAEKAPAVRLLVATSDGAPSVRRSSFGPHRVGNAFHWNHRCHVV
jgi:hypothetical protein